MTTASNNKIQHVFICGSKSIGQYGGFETFVDKLSEYLQECEGIQLHIACKGNGNGCMDESKLVGTSQTVLNEDNVEEFQYHNAHCFKLSVPEKLGPAQAIYYDVAAMNYSIQYCKKNHIEHPVFYILACRIGPFIRHFKRKIHSIGGKLYINPDGHEWKRAKWSGPVKKYWKFSEKLMVKHSDLIICDSITIEQYIKEEYKKFSPKTIYISYGSETRSSTIQDDDPALLEWYEKHSLKKCDYYLIVGRFVPENNYETMIREYMNSHTDRALAIITDINKNFLAELESKNHYSTDRRIKFVGTVYDRELLKKIRENAFGYLHGHEVGGTNPSLLEALGSTSVNLLLDVGFNREVGQDAALYWKKESGDLEHLIDFVEAMNENERLLYGEKAKRRINEAYSWDKIASEYLRLWLG